MSTDSITDTMSTDPLVRERAAQQQALQLPSSADTAATLAYRRIYAGVRWAPLPALAPDFATRALARVGIVEEDLGKIERRAVPLLFATFGIGGGLTAGPQLLAALGQVAFDVAGLPWLQAAAAITAIATAAALDKFVGGRRLSRAQ